MAFSPLRRSFNRFGKNLFPFAAVLVGLALVTTGCHRAVTDPKDPNFIVAEKGSWQITRGQLTTEVNDYLKHHQMTVDQVGPAKMPLLESAVLDNIVLEKILLDHATALPLKDVDKDEATAFDRVKGRYPNQQEFDQQLKTAGLTVDALKKRIHEQVLIHKVLETEALQNTEPTEQEINDFYLKNKERFNTPPKIRASRILVLVDPKTSPEDKAAKKKIIDQAHDRVAHGEDFSKVATAVSEDRYSAPKGGDIGFFQKGENEPQFDTVAFSSKPGVLSAVFETPMGYQFLKVTESQPGGPVSIADARTIIANYLRQARQGERVNAYTSKLLAQSGVVYHVTRVNPNQPDSAPGNPPAAAPANAAPAPANGAAPQ